MSERYSRLFALPEDLYCAGSPVVIAAGTLLKDNQNGKVIAQLKLRSISEKTIKAVKVKLNLFDTAGNPVGDSVEYSYLDLNAGRDAEFGQKSPIAVADAKSRSYQASVTEVVFVDQSVWTANDGKWEPLAKPAPLPISDPELLKQYQMHYGSDARYAAKAEKDLWHCTCGALNHEDESCHVCGHSLAELQSVDMAKLTAEKDARLEEAACKAAEEQAAADAQKKKTTKILAIVIPSVCAVIASVLLITNVIIPNSKYNDAVALMDAGSYEEAIAAFEAMDGYKDSIQKIKDCELAILEGKYNNAVALMEAGNYEEAASAFNTLFDFKDSQEKAAEAEIAAKYASAESLLNDGKTAQAAIAFGKIADYKDSGERSKTLWDQTAHRDTIRAGDYHTVALRSDGSCVAVGKNNSGQCDVGGWTDIVAVSAGSHHSVGLRKDGTVVAVGDNKYGQCDVSNWTDIVAVSACNCHTVGLRIDGTVVTTGSNLYSQCDVNDWTDIIAVSAGDFHTVGLRRDGTVVATGNDSENQCCVGDWTNIVTVIAGGEQTIGVRSNGTLIAVGEDFRGTCAVGSWSDIVAVSTSNWYTVGVKSNGTVIATGSYDEHRNVSGWTDIVAVSSGWDFTVGLRSDGTVVAVGDNADGQCDVSGWTNIKLP